MEGTAGNEVLGICQIDVTVLRIDGKSVRISYARLGAVGYELIGLDRTGIDIDLIIRGRRGPIYRVIFSSHNVDIVTADSHVRNRLVNAGGHSILAVLLFEAVELGCDVSIVAE